jgi:hypothetical protein
MYTFFISKLSYIKQLDIEHRKPVCLLPFDLVFALRNCFNEYTKSNLERTD